MNIKQQSDQSKSQFQCKNTHVDPRLKAIQDVKMLQLLLGITAEIIHRDNCYNRAVQWPGDFPKTSRVGSGSRKIPVRIRIDLGFRGLRRVPGRI